MLGFEPRISGVGSDRSTNWATTTAPDIVLLPNTHDQAEEYYVSEQNLGVFWDFQWS